MIFDQGLGDLFVVRVAGNVADDIGIASIEYAVEHLGSRLIVVLGHERCGAVTAAVKGGELPGHLPALMAALKPAVDKVKGAGGDAVDATIVANVELTAALLRDFKPIIAEMVEKGEIKVFGAPYELDGGEVALVKERRTAAGRTPARGRRRLFRVSPQPALGAGRGRLSRRASGRGRGGRPRTMGRPAAASER